MDYFYLFQIFIGIIITVTVYEYFTIRLATFTHEMNHYKEAYKHDKCDAIILLRTIFIGGKREFHWRANKITIKLIPIGLWKEFEMKGTLGRVYFSNEYRPYTNNELVSISRAGLYGSFKGYAMSSLLLGIIYMIFCITVMELPVLYAIIYALIIVFTVCLSFSIIKTLSYLAAGKKPGWSDRAIELNPDGYRAHLKSLESDNLHTYSGITKMV